MVKKLLILRSEKIFFPKGPHIYQYLAEKFGKLEKFEKLNKKYQAEKIRRSMPLKEVWDAVLNGVEKGQLIGESVYYAETYLNTFLETFSKKVHSKGYEIASFSSFPKIFFLQANNNAAPVDYPYGMVSKLKKGVITGFQDIKFHKENYVKKEMRKLGFKEKFTHQPNHYGMLGQLIELMREKDFTI
ncbi:MAG: hypothetical protein Athens101410_708 [Parcubacteria group bacterium Athens1014_10]|nr:MAG: hypothetical protein Athens101410_708 [Parcubacteria group bacterium Athens1014_10]TSD04693.1 MAG: hypothetical protein Athens071412_688 [Parcubacteria group bacterium Athens0714_12]